MSEELATDHFLPLYVGDFLASTSTWSGPERGLYIQLLMLQWGAKKLPNDLLKLSRAVGYTKAEFDELWPIMAEKFKEQDGFLLNPRLEEIRSRNAEIVEARKIAGQRGANARWNSKGNAVANGKGNGKIMPPEPNRTEIENQEIGASAPPRATRLPADFSLTPERRIVAEAEKQNPERTFQAFTDYWKAASGQSARKMDWDATWRNWCRRQADFSPKKAESGRASNIPSATNETDLLIARAARIGFRAQIPGEPVFRYEDALKEAERKAQPRPQPKFATVSQ